MPVTCTENPDSRQYTDGESAELTYTIRGTADEGSSLAALKATAPTLFNALVRQPCAVEPIYIDTSNAGGCIWTGTARYAPADAQEPETGDSTFSFDTGGGTQHITQSLSTPGSYAPAGSTPPNFRGAVGVTQDSVEGVDITVPIYNFSETHYLPAATVTNAYKGVLFNLTGKVNAGAFRGLAAGECLFLGASGSLRVPESDPSGGDWEITFKFAGSPNRTGITIGTIAGVSKKGWEYLWVRYADVEDGASNTLVKQPIAAYVEKVYDEASFAGLGIG